MERKCFIVFESPCLLWGFPAIVTIGVIFEKLLFLEKCENFLKDF